MHDPFPSDHCAMDGVASSATAVLIGYLAGDADRAGRQWSSPGVIAGARAAEATLTAQ